MDKQAHACEKAQYTCNIWRLNAASQIISKRSEKVNALLRAMGKITLLRTLSQTVPPVQRLAFWVGKFYWMDKPSREIFEINKSSGWKGIISSSNLIMNCRRRIFCLKKTNHLAAEGESAVLTKCSIGLQKMNHHAEGDGWIIWMKNIWDSQILSLRRIQHSRYSRFPRLIVRSHWMILETCLNI